MILMMRRNPEPPMMVQVKEHCRLSLSVVVKDFSVNVQSESAELYDIAELTLAE